MTLAGMFAKAHRLAHVPKTTLSDNHTLRKSLHLGKETRNLEKIKGKSQDLVPGVSTAVGVGETMWTGGRDCI